MDYESTARHAIAAVNTFLADNMLNLVPVVDIERNILLLLICDVTDVIEYILPLVNHNVLLQCQQWDVAKIRILSGFLPTSSQLNFNPSSNAKPSQTLNRDFVADPRSGVPFDSKIQLY